LEPDAKLRWQYSTDFSCKKGAPTTLLLHIWKLPAATRVRWAITSRFRVFAVPDKDEPLNDAKCLRQNRLFEFLLLPQTMGPDLRLVVTE